MGSYVSTSKFIQLPFRAKKPKWGSQELEFNEKNTDQEIIETIVSSNLSRIQTVAVPSDEDIVILNEILKRNPNITIRHYGGWGDSVIDISYLTKLSHMKNLWLDIYSKISNIEILQELKLESLGINCFNVKNYSFLRNLSPSISDLTLLFEDKSYKIDINDIVHLKDLKKLGIRNVKKGLDKLVEFKNLKELSLRSISINDYSFLKEMNVSKIYLGFQKSEYFNTFGLNEKIEEVSLWRNSNLTDLSFLLQFPNLKKIIISSQSKVENIPNLTSLNKLEEFYFLDRNIEEVKKHCNTSVKIYSQYNPIDIS